MRERHYGVNILACRRLSLDEFEFQRTGLIFFFGFHDKTSFKMQQSRTIVTPCGFAAE
jgi:hypothetical protein